MSDTNLEDAEGPGRETHPTTSPDAPMAEADDAGVAADVEPAATPAKLGLPDHLIRHETFEQAYEAYAQRTRPHPSFGELMDDRDAQRRDSAARLEHWLSGGDA